MIDELIYRKISIGLPTYRQYSINVCLNCWPRDTTSLESF